MSEPNAPQDPPAVQPPETPQVALPATEEPPASEKIEFTRAALDKRIEQAGNAAISKFLKSVGFDDPTSLATFKKQADEKAKADEEARRAELSELERLRADVADRDAKLAQEQTAKEEALQIAEAARIETHLHRVFSEKGITATDYALFKLEQKAASLGDGEEEFDEGAFLDELLADEREAFALGVGSAPQSTATPAQTTSDGKKPNPPQPNQPASKHASQMSEEEYAAHRKALLAGTSR